MIKSDKCLFSIVHNNFRIFKQLIEMRQTTISVSNVDNNSNIGNINHYNNHYNDVWICHYILLFRYNKIFTL